MIVYKDRTFCIRKDCKHKQCPLLVTEELKAEAEAFGLPLAVIEFNDCYEKDSDEISMIIDRLNPYRFEKALEYELDKLNNNVDNDLQYVLFRELGGIDFLDSNNQNIDPTDETIDWDYMINQAINLIIELYNNNKSI